MNTLHKTDVAFWGMTNSRSRLTMERAIAACVGQGLRTTLLWSEQLGRVALVPGDYDIPGLHHYKVNLRLSYGPLHYPRPITLLLLLNTVYKVIDDLKPKCIVTQLDHTAIDKVWQFAATAREIPGVVIQEGMTNIPKKAGFSGSRSSRDHWLMGKMGFFDGLIARWPHPLLRFDSPYTVADFVCAWGEAMTHHLIRLGRAPETIVATGSPAFDNVLHREPLKSTDRRTVLYVQQRMGMPFEERKSFYKQIIEVVTMKLGCSLIFKLHPNSFDEAEGIREIAAGLQTPPEKFELVAEGDAVDLLEGVSVVVLASSTTAYHAALKGIPLIIVDYYSPRIGIEVGVENPVSVVTKPTELFKTLKLSLFDMATRELLYEENGRMLDYHLGQLDGGAARRIATFIGELITRQPPLGRR